MLHRQLPRRSGARFLAHGFGGPRGELGEQGHLPLLHFSALAVHPRHPSIVYAGGYYGEVYRSTDGGSHWRRLPSRLPGGFAGALVIDPHDPRTLYAGTPTRGFYAITLRR